MALSKNAQNCTEAVLHIKPTLLNMFALKKNDFAEILAPTSRRPGAPETDFEFSTGPADAHTLEKQSKINFQRKT